MMLDLSNLSSLQHMLLMESAKKNKARYYYHSFGGVFHYFYFEFPVSNGLSSPE